jgi:hypothetical protein
MVRTFGQAEKREMHVHRSTRSSKERDRCRAPRLLASFDTGEINMTSLKTVAAAALLSALTVTPVFAQAAIQEPGLFAFYHPYLDVLNGGAPTPAAKLASEPPAAMEAYAARESGISTYVDASRARRHRFYDPASGALR